jgi:hypothetical protein
LAATSITGYRDNDRDDHDRHMVSHAHRRDDTVNREHQIEQQDLRDRGAKPITAAFSKGLPSNMSPPGVGSMLWWISLVAFQRRNRPPAMRIMSFHDKALPNSSTTGSVSWTIQATVPSKPKRRTSEASTDAPRSLTLMLRKLVGQKNRNEDQVIDTENHLHGDQGGQATQVVVVVYWSRTPI